MAIYRYLLDTNILSSLYCQPQGLVYQHLQRVGEASVCTSLIVAAELRFGAHKRGSAVLSAWVEQLLGAIDVLPLDAPVDQRYAEIRAHLERTGQMIGANDLWIAAHALQLDLVLVTDNISEFQRVPNLQVTNWLNA